jgi:hypothetical protein
MAGLVPAIHDLRAARENPIQQVIMGPRDKPGDDGVFCCRG